MGKVVSLFRVSCEHSEAEFPSIESAKGSSNSNSNDNSNGRRGNGVYERGSGAK